MRAIIFEKNEKCEFKDTIIGSCGCLICPHLIGIDNEEHTIKCWLNRFMGMYYDGVDKITDLTIKIKQLENEIESLKGVYNGKK